MHLLFHASWPQEYFGSRLWPLAEDLQGIFLPYLRLDTITDDTDIGNCGSLL